MPEASAVRRILLFHSLASFLFLSTVLAALLNALNAFLKALPAAGPESPKPVSTATIQPPSPC
ncbi:MAG: hypothetical protein ACK6BG_10200 [Cyanobacteriota bacterium]